MSELSDNPVIAALTFKVPQKVGWSVQHEDQSWTGANWMSLLNAQLPKGDANRLLCHFLSSLSWLGTKGWYGRHWGYPLVLRLKCANLQGVHLPPHERRGC